MAKLTEEEKKEYKRNLFIALGLLPVIAVIVTIIVLCNLNGDDDIAPSVSGSVSKTDVVFYYATGAAKDIVRGELLYPSSSTFEDESTYSVKYDASSGVYTVTGYVNAANGFNAKKKMFFRVELTLSDLNKDQYSYRKVSCSIT